MTSLAGRHAVVTGANRGIGAAIAQTLSRDGARVTLLVRDYAAGEVMRATLPGAAQVVQADITDEQAVNKACELATSAFGPAHFLVNNAGHAESAPFSRTDDAMLARMLSVHLYGPVYCTRALLPGMIAEQFGRIVNIASIAGVAGAPYITAYCAAKHAMVGLTRALAKEVIARGITVNAVCPGYTDTDLVSAGIERIRERTGRTAADAKASMLASNPLQRMITPAEVASAVRWLCDDGAASTTGQTIVIDGGELA
ncbi:MAG: SDR family oxidoreductase [Phycisphaerae bacterium]|nr:SDR family oxidoreductase [Gemmatimonadaceae bacterium]